MGAALMRILTWTFVFGGVCFALGFFGPMLLAPGANQGPLLGILITGPLGVVFGFAIGVIRELLGKKAGPAEVFSNIDWKSVRRVGAALLGLLLLVRGSSALADGVGRPAGASIVIAIVLLSYAWMGQIPSWFRR